MVTTRGQIKKTKIIFEKYSQNHLPEDSDEQPSESGALIGSNDDILTEILLRLPALSILRFKSVSKHWQSLLSHRYFTVRYDNLFKSPGFIAENEYFPFDDENEDTSHFFIRDLCVVPHGNKVEQSCNGLLLCRSYTTEIDAHKYYVLNPTTRQFAIIPSVPGGKAVRKTITFMALAYHQTDCVHYKVVCIRELDGARHLFQILIYSSDTRKWKISVESFSNRDFRDFSIKKAVYWNGAIHWFPCFLNHVYFDILSERLQTYSSSEETTMSGKVPRYLWESRGHLHLILTDYRDYSSSFAFDIYEMLSDYSGWFVKYRVDLDELTSEFPEMINHRSGLRYYVMDVVRGEKEEDTFLVLRIPNNMITYNVHDKSVTVMFDNVHNDMQDGYLDYHRHAETLTSF